MDQQSRRTSTPEAGVAGVTVDERGWGLRTVPEELAERYRREGHW